ncbi:MAG: hypothetical protein WC023_06575 [Rhodocyclaceae bacterium]
MNDLMQWLADFSKRLSEIAASLPPEPEFPPHYRAPTWKPGDPEPATPAA